MTRRRKRGLSSIDRHSLRVSASTFSAAIRSAPELSLAGASSHRPRRYPAGTAGGQPVLMMVMVLSYGGCARRDGPVRAGQARCRTVSVTFHATRQLGARMHAHVADSVAAVDITQRRFHR